MRISIFGLGYVGCVSGACLAELGHSVLGVDINRTKIEMINQGLSPIIEKDIDLIIARVVQSGKFRATDDTAQAIQNSDIALICVGTPSQHNGDLDLRSVEAAAQQIGEALRKAPHYVVVVVRSTVLPGTVDHVVIPLLEERSGKKAGRDFGVCMNPEFLREGSSVEDFYHPPKNVVGEFDARSGDALMEIYRRIEAKSFRVPIKTAEMVKYCDNTFHALKVSYANEIGNICQELGIDSHQVMSIFCADTKLNISTAYLKPGFSFGGSCLPKDLRALVHKASDLDVETPVLKSILPSNKAHTAKAISKILEFKGKTIGFLGLSFKGGTDDMRESPTVEVIEHILGKGFKVRIYDKSVSIARLLGANKQYIEEEIPHISSLLDDDINNLLKQCEVIVISNQTSEFRGILEGLGEDKTVIDLVRITEDRPALKAAYFGICW